MKLQIGVIGYAGVEEYPPGKGPTTKHFELAFKMGELIATEKWVLLTGGKGGIMDESSRGAHLKNGVTVGFLRGRNRFEANKETDVEVITGFEVGGSEFTLVHSADAVVVVGGGAGTLQEVAIAYRLGKPIYVLAPLPMLKNSEYLDERKMVQFQFVETPHEVIAHIKRHFGKKIKA